MENDIKSQKINTEEEETLLLILKHFVAKSQLEIAAKVILELKRVGCYSRSGRQIFASELKVQGPRATIYRVVSVLEKKGFLDRESKYSGYFLSHNFANRLEDSAEKWRRFAKG